ncbi:TonB-dependent receptor [bacterium]|nr:TonB-dependent receptor [bacterium]
MLRLSTTLFFALIVYAGSFVFADQDVSESACFEYDENEKAYIYSTTIRVVNDKPDDPYSIHELPAFVTVIKLDPDNPRFQTLPEILSSSVGVTVKDFGGLGKLSTISIRGSSANQVVVLLDGVKINTSSDLGVDLSNISLNNIEKIEILRGSDSAVYGTGAIGGVVNLVSRKSASEDSHLGGRMVYGSFSTLVSDLDYNMKFSRWTCHLSGYYSKSDGDFSFSNDNGTHYDQDDDFEDIRTNNALESGGGSLWWRVPFSSNWDVSGIFDGYYADKGIPGIITFPSEHAVQVDRRITANIRMRRSNLWKQGNSFTLELFNKWIGLDFDDPYGEQIGVPIHTRQRTTSFGGKVSYNIGHSKGNGSVAIHYLGELLKDESFDSPKRTTLAISGKHDLGMFNEKLWITTLARYDDISAIGDHFSPKLGVRWFMTPKLSLKSNIGGAFRSPSFNELYMNMGYITGNPDLQPETGVSFDLGVLWEKSLFFNWTPRI